LLPYYKYNENKFGSLDLGLYIWSMENKNRIDVFTNCTQARFHNRRISAETLKDKSIGIRIDVADFKDEPRSDHHYKRGITTTRLKLTKEACEALIIVLQEELKK
jgi:hypothetical protein